MKPKKWKYGKYGVRYIDFVYFSNAYSRALTLYRCGFISLHDIDSYVVGAIITKYKICKYGIQKR